MHGNQGAAPKMTDASMAPKPNEFDIAYLSFLSRAARGT
jgi:hypothetical protein